MLTSSGYPINSVNTDKALGILQHYLRKVAKYQHVSEVLTNNILTNFINILHNLQTLVSNTASASIDTLFPIIFEIFFLC